VIYCALCIWYSILLLQVLIHFCGFKNVTMGIGLCAGLGPALKCHSFLLGSQFMEECCIPSFPD